MKENDQLWMEHALELAKKAESQGEVPVGAVMVLENKIIGEGWNQPISTCDPSAHAEIVALRSAANTLNNYRLPNSTIYVTLEPCMMCLGSLIHARVKRLVFGAYDKRTGALESAFQLGGTDKLNHRVQYLGGVLAEQCGLLLSQFFQAKRQQ